MAVHLLNFSMKHHIPTLVMSLVLFSAGSFAQSNNTDSLKQVKKAKAAEQGAKADVYIVKKSLGNSISEPADSPTVKATTTVKKNSTRKTRKVSCSSKNNKQKKD